MISFEYIEAKRKKYERKYAVRTYKALNEMIKPFIEQTYYKPASEIDLDISITSEPMYNLYKDLYMSVGAAFVKDYTSLLLKDAQYDLWEMAMLEYIEQYTGNEIILITNYTKETIQRAVKKNLELGLEKGLSIGDMMKELRKDITKGDYARFTKARALRIAQTEILSASNYGSYIAAKESGFVNQKTWNTSYVGVSKTERHTAIPGLHGQKRNMDEMFDVDGEMMRYPGDPAGGAHNVINCKCYLTYEVL